MFALLGRMLVAIACGIAATVLVFLIILELFPGWGICPMGCSQTELSAGAMRDFTIAVTVFGATSATVLTLIWKKP
jgi:hypothetical protein